MKRAYAGIGSRKTPGNILIEMEKIGVFFAKAGYIVRSGAADGADSAFERGCDKVGGDKQIFLPWKGFNGSKSCYISSMPSAFDIAAECHPAWHRCDATARKMHARNSHQVLGPFLDSPVEFVVCWHTGSGGTTQACRIADTFRIKVYNLSTAEDRDKLHELFIAVKEIRNAQNQA